MKKVCTNVVCSLRLFYTLMGLYGAAVLALNMAMGTI